MGNIRFFSEDIDFIPQQKTKLQNWISIAIKQHHKKLKSVNYIFTSDGYLSGLNKKYLKHNTLTDIITFDLSSDYNVIEADIFISVERVRENSKNLNVSFVEELHRVMIHGILHLMGYGDKDESEKKEMRKKENHYLALRF